MELGWSYRRIEAETGVRRETISRHDATRRTNAAKVFAGSPPNAAKVFPGSTPPRASAAVYREAITEKLDAGLSAQRIWQDLVEEFGHGASYESVKRFVRTLAPRPRAVGVFHHAPGHHTQHDFGKVIVQFLDGTKKRIHFFASRLKYSRWVEVTIVANQQVETLARTLVDHFGALGGVLLLEVLDRPKTVALKWQKNGDVTEWSPIFAGVVLDLGLGIEVCWPHAPQQKGAVENPVGWVKDSFSRASAG